MTIFPTPFLGRSQLFQGSPAYLALGRSVATVSGVVIQNMQPRASADGQFWEPIDLGGDLRKTGRSDGYGAFFPVRITRFKGKTYVFGALFKSTAGANSVVFSSVDGRNWLLEDAPLQTAGASLFPEGWAVVAQNADYLAGVQPGGQLVWTDGTDWFSRTDLPLSGSGYRAYVMTASAGGFVIGGNGPSATAIISATTPGGTWTARSHPFSINTPTFAASGDVALIFAIYSPANSAYQLISAPLSDLTGWASRSFVANRYVDFAFFGGGRWFAGGAGNHWLTSTNAVAGWTDAAKPWGAAENRPCSGYYVDGKWHVHYGNGGLAISDDGETWQNQPNSGLGNVPYIAAAIAA